MEGGSERSHEKNMIFRISKRSSSRRELKNINKICPNSSKKHDYSIRDSSNSDSGYCISSDRDRDKIIQPTKRNETKKLDHVVTNNVKNKYQCNYAIEYEPIFDSRFSLSGGTKEPLPVVTIIP